MKKVLLVVIMLTVSITFAGTTFAAKKKVTQKVLLVQVQSLVLFH